MSNTTSLISVIQGEQVPAEIAMAVSTKKSMDMDWTQQAMQLKTRMMAEGITSCWKPLLLIESLMSKVILPEGYARLGYTPAREGVEAHVQLTFTSKHSQEFANEAGIVAKNDFMIQAAWVNIDTSGDEGLTGVFYTDKLVVECDNLIDSESEMGSAAIKKMAENAVELAETNSGESDIYNQHLVVVDIPYNLERSVRAFITVENGFTYPSYKYNTPR